MRIKNVGAFCFYLAAIAYYVAAVLYLRRNAAFTVTYLSLGTTMLCLASMESKRDYDIEDAEE